VISIWGRKEKSNENEAKQRTIVLIARNQKLETDTVGCFVCILDLYAVGINITQSFFVIWFRDVFVDVSVSV